MALCGAACISQLPVTLVGVGIGCRGRQQLDAQFADQETIAVVLLR